MPTLNSPRELGFKSSSKESQLVEDANINPTTTIPAGTSRTVDHQSSNTRPLALFSGLTLVSTVIIALTASLYWSPLIVSFLNNTTSNVANDDVKASTIFPYIHLPQLKAPFSSPQTHEDTMSRSLSQEIIPTLSSSKQEAKARNPVSTFIHHFFVPFWSKEYRLQVTSRCIEDAIARSVSNKKKLTDVQDEEDSLKALQKEFRWDTFLTLYYVNLERTSPTKFSQLRQESFNIPEEVYYSTLVVPLKPLSGLGLSGSVFFHTQTSEASNNAGLLIKSITRSFEYNFLHKELIPAYVKYMQENEGESLLTRITDILSGREVSVGGLLRMSPRHWMVMADLLGDLKKDQGGKKWDLKPSGFFEPTRDLIPDSLKAETTKSGLADALDPEDHIILTKGDKQALVKLLEKDTAWLEELGVIDYSLLVGRWPAALESELQSPIGYGPQGLVRWFFQKFQSGTDNESEERSPEDGGFKNAVREEWQHGRKDERDAGRFIGGVKSADGKWIYRMSIVDFMWNVGYLRPMITKVAGKAIPEQTITTDPGTYRKEFLKMVDEYVETR